MASTFNARDPAVYERSMGRWSRRLAQPFLAYAGVRDGERLLDVGCGTGSLSYALAAASPAGQVAAVDASALYLDAARCPSPMAASTGCCPSWCCNSSPMSRVRWPRCAA